MIAGHTNRAMRGGMLSAFRQSFDLSEGELAVVAELIRGRKLPVLLVLRENLGDAGTVALSVALEACRQVVARPNVMLGVRQLFGEVQYVNVAFHRPTVLVARRIGSS